MPLSAAHLPLDLPRLIMRRAGVVGVLVLLISLVSGLWRTQEVIDNEVNAAMALAEAMAELGRLSLQPEDDAQVLFGLRSLQKREELRHLTLSVHDAQGQALLAPSPHRTGTRELEWLFALHRTVWPDHDLRSVAWQIPRANQSRWTVTLQASPEGEREEALVDLAGMLVILAIGGVGLWWMLRWNVRQAFAPLTSLLQAIDHLRHSPLEGVSQLPTMPIRELEVIAEALRRLGSALAQAEHQRRQLSHKVLTLQEEERTRLARELHDELGQQLTALRLDAAWLKRQTASTPDTAAVAQAMADRCGQLQQGIRRSLAQLRPLGPGQSDDRHEHPSLPLVRLQTLLHDLVHGWQHTRSTDPQHPTTFAWHCSVRDAQGGALLADEEQTPCWLPQDLILAVYRLSQEALTNAARHAQAHHVELRLVYQAYDSTAEHGHLLWSVEDDGVGLSDLSAAMQRGNGLGGMQERVWALEGQWHVMPGPNGRGTRLQAALPWHLAPPTAATDAAATRPLPPLATPEIHPQPHANP